MILDWKFLGCLGFVGLGTVGWRGVGLIRANIGLLGCLWAHRAERVQDPFTFPTALVETLLAAGCA